MSGEIATDGDVLPGRGKLGTFLGVYTPTVLTILGVIMYLRLGWVVGQVGVLGALSIVVIAHVITTITTLAFSSVATNVRVGVGGAYNIISRSLGVEVGGAIGLPLFLSQTLSVTLYAFGLAEALRFVVDDLPVQPTAAVIVVLVGLLALKGADVALRIQLPLMAAIGLSLLALMVGCAFGERVDLPPDAVREPATVSYWVVFAVFFPAVTGIMAGLGLSGDLADPGRSLPRGAITAVATGFLVYISLPLLLSVGATPDALRADRLMWTHVVGSLAPGWPALGAILVMPGLFGAIFSSAVGSVLGAPRTLQALALDGLGPRRLAGSGEGEPVLGIVLTTLLALSAVLLGDLDAVAEVVSMFFLTVYGMVNLVAALETLAGDPSWRPRLRIPGLITLVGGIGCLAVMFLISPVASLVAISVEGLLWAYLRRRESAVEFGDARRGAYESMIRWALVKLADRPMSARNWRPHVLVFADDLQRRMALVRFGAWFSAGRGVVTVCELVVGDVMDATIDPRPRRDAIRETLARAGVTAFPEVDIVEDVIPGMVSIAQANGIAGLDSNTVVVGLPRSPDRLAQFLRVLRRMEKLERSMVILRPREDRMPPAADPRSVHVWWGGRQANGDLMLLLAHLLTRNPEWRRARLDLITITGPDEDAAGARAALEKLVAEVRIPARAVVVERLPGQEVSAAIVDYSAAADAVFLGLNVPATGEAVAYAERLIELADALPTVFFVRNCSPFRGELV